jgi:hypothetical protein
VVTEASALEVTPVRSSALHDDDDTRKDLPRRPRRPATISTDSLSAADGMSMSSSSSSSSSGAPAAMSASGVFRPLPGVHRDVTGLFFPELDELKADGKSGRVWYAAVDSRPRGPFSASEMVSLAEKGKIRESTLVWRPGFSTWKQVRGGEDAAAVAVGEDLGWLKKIVRARKLRESEAQRRAEANHGIKPVSLTRTSAGRRPHAWQPGNLSSSSLGFGNPPPLPDDADDGAGGMPSVDGIVPLAEISGFQWRADDEHRRMRAAGTRRRQSLMLWALAFAALVVIVAAGTSLALKTQAMERLVTALLP